MSLLQLPQQNAVPWARLLPRGGEGGVDAYQIDASGLDVRNRMMYRMLLPRGNAPSVRGQLRLRSTLTVGNPAFEGVAMRVRGFDRAGREVWDSRPEVGGKRRWFGRASTDWVDVVFIEPISRSVGIEYVTFELEVRGQSGQVTISDVDCRHHYAYTIDVGSTGSRGWLNHPSLTIAGNRTYRKQIVRDGLEPVGGGLTPTKANTEIVRWVRYERTEPIYINEGQLITTFMDASLAGQAIEHRTIGGTTTYRALRGSRVGAMLKFRRKGEGQYDFIDAGNGSADLDFRSIQYQQIVNSVTHRAKRQYDQVETQLYIETTAVDVASGFAPGVPGWSSGLIDAEYPAGGATSLLKKDVEIEITVADYLEPTQS